MLNDLVYLAILAPYALKRVNKTQPSSFLAEFGVKSIRRDGDITHDNSQYIVNDSPHNVFDTAFVKVAMKNQMNNAMICQFCVKRLIIGIYNLFLLNSLLLTLSYRCYLTVKNLINFLIRQKQPPEAFCKKRWS